MSLRWNGMLIENPGFLIHRPTAWQRFNDKLEHTAVRWAWTCIIVGAIAGRLSAPAFGY